MDQFIVQALHSVNGRVPALDVFAVFCAQALIYIVGIGLLVVIIRSSRGEQMSRLAAWRARLQTILLTLLSLLIARGIITSLIHVLYSRPRPFVALGWQSLIEHMATPSFPSGHATSMFALAFIGWQVNRRWGWYFFAAAMLAAIARVYAGVHWPSDVIAGAVIGMLAVVGARYGIIKK